MTCERRGEVCERCKEHIKQEEHICEKEQANWEMEKVSMREGEKP